MGNRNSINAKQKIKRSLTNNIVESQIEAKLLSDKKTKKLIDKKKNSKLRLFFQGKDAENFVCNLFDSILEKDNKIQIKNKNNVIYKILEISRLKWIIYILDEFITDEICKFIIDEIIDHFKNDHYCCYDALVPLIENMNEAEIIIKNFEKIFKRQTRKQPFILFLSKTEEKPDLLSFQNLVKEDFDKRNINVDTIKINDLKDEKKKEEIFSNIKSKIFKIYSYYNGMGDMVLIPSGYIIEKKHLFPYQLNILTCGKPGLGKSSFINIILKEKRAKEGEGRAITSDIIRYSHPFFPIAFYDTPGTDKFETVQMLKDELELYNIKLKEAKKKIHLIIWFIRYDNRVDIENEKLLLDNLLKFDAEFLFVINYVNNSIGSEEYNVKIEIILESLEEIFGDKIPDLKERIIPINLLNDTNEGKIRTPQFGLDCLFYKIHSIFKKYIENLVLIKTDNKVSFMERISENKLFSEIIKREDIKFYLKIEASKLIINAAMQVFWSIYRESKREKMIKDLISLYFGSKIIKGIGFFEDFMKKIFEMVIEIQIKKDGPKFYSDLFFEDLRKINNIYEFNFDYDVFFYNTYTIAVGYLVIQNLETFLNKEEENFENSLKNAVASYTAAIEAVKLIGDDFKKNYSIELIKLLSQ